MEPHSHPEHEHTFSRVARTLERVTEVLEAQARRGMETDDRITRLAARVDELLAHVEMVDLKLTEATDKLNGLIDLVDRQQRERYKH
jgi:hypothetical protein